MFNVYRFISTTVNAAALRSALQFLFTRARHDATNENVATIELAYIVCNYLLIFGKADKSD